MPNGYFMLLHDQKNMIVRKNFGLFAIPVNAD